ncbi:TPA: hypothetical protein EYP66_14680 [Candidatus Poribacteria bacterium]|nr:hypothetical protein [Candidatus Poribacteria bacterium]
MRQKIMKSVQVIYCWLIIISAASPVWSAEQLSVGTRPRGMGNTFSAIADDATAIFWNPAGISQMQRYELQDSYTRLYQLEGVSQNHLAFVLPFTKNFAIGLDWMNLSISDEELDFSRNNFTLSYSHSFWDRIAFGVNLKYITSNTGLDRITLDKASGYGVDFGGLFKPIKDRLHLGIMWQDVTGTSIQHETGKKEQIFQTNRRVGAAYYIVRNTKNSWMKDLVFAADVDDRIHIGAELWTPKYSIPGGEATFSLRGGLQKDRYTEEPMTYTFGATAKYRELSFNYALVIPPSLPVTNLFSLSLDWEFQRSPIRILHVEIVPDGLFIAHHEFYAMMNKVAPVIIVREFLPEEGQAEVHCIVNEQAKVISGTPSLTSIKFRTKDNPNWRNLDVETLLESAESGDELLMPSGSKLRVKTEREGNLVEYVAEKLKYELEEEDKIGRIWLENRSKKFVDITVKMLLEAGMPDFQDVTSPYRMPPRSIVSISIQSLNLNYPRILSRAQNETIVAKVAVASYTKDTPHKDVSLDTNFTLYGKNSLLWTNEEDLLKLGSFITPKDEAIKKLAEEAVAMYKITPPPQSAPNIYKTLWKAQLYYALLSAYGIVYSSDPLVSSFRSTTVDTIKFARETLQQRYGEIDKKSAADCDDSTVLLASLLLAAGINVALITQPHHILLAFDTGIPREIAEKISLEGLKSNSWYLDFDQRAWIPIETTLLGKKELGFADAWETAMLMIEKDGFDNAAPVKLAQDKYKPAAVYADVSWKPKVPSKDKIDQILAKGPNLIQAIADGVAVAQMKKGPEESGYGSEKGEEQK